MEFIKKNYEYILSVLFSLLLSVCTLWCIPAEKELINNFTYGKSSSNSSEILESVYGYEENNQGELVSTTDDSRLIFNFNESVINQVTLQIDSEQKSFPIEIYYANEENGFNEQQKLRIVYITGEDKTIDISSKNKYIRIDIGDNSGQEFILKKIEFSESVKHYFTPFRISVSALLFIIGMFLSKQFFKKRNKIEDFIRKNDFLSKHGLQLICVFSSIIIFLILYSNFIFNDYVYIYSDSHMGSDTIDVYYPAYYLMSEKIHTGNLSFFDLRIGLGSSIFSLFTGFSVFDILIFLFPSNLIHLGIIIATGLKFIVIAWFAVLLFSHYFTNNKVILTTSLLWTFCSYTVMWGQHYSFATAMAYFTVFMYCLNEFLSFRQRSSLKLAIICAIICTSYYFFWMFGLFSIGYSIIYCYKTRYSLKIIFNRIFYLGLMAMFGFALSAFLLLPEINVFLESARTASNSESIKWIHSYDTFVSLLSRLLSSDLIGSNYILYHPYSGTVNYYEMAFLNTTILCIPSIIYTFKYKCKGILEKCVFILMFLLILSPITNFVFTLNSSTFRWTFIYIFVFIILQGYLLDDLDYVSKYQIRKISVGFFIVYFSIVMFLLFNSFFIKNITINLKLLLLITIFVVISIYLMWNRKWKQITVSILIAIMLFESLFTDYYSINRGGYLKKDEFYASNYYDGSIELINQIKKDDSNIYRINKNYNSRLYNDSQVQNYFGLSSYNSYNLKEFLNVCKFYEIGTNLGFEHSNYLSISLDDIYLNDLLGVKYYLSKNKNGSIDFTKNERWLPFGFMYDSQISLDSNIPNSLANLFGYYCSETGDGEDIDGLINESIAINYTLDKTLDGDGGYQSRIQFSCPDNCFDLSLNLSLEVKTKNKVTVSIYNLNNELVDTNSRTLFRGNNEFNAIFNVKEQQDSVYYIELSFDNDDVEIKNSILNFYNSNLIDNQIKKLRKNKIDNLKINKDQLTGIVENKDNDIKMLYVPLLFSNSWNVTLDDKPVQIQKINDGFIGIEIPKGKHKLKMVYKQAGFGIGITISVISLLMLLLCQSRYKIFTKIDKNLERK